MDDPLTHSHTRLTPSRFLLEHGLELARPMRPLLLVLAIGCLGCLIGLATGKRIVLARAAAEADNQAEVLAVKAQGLLSQYALFPDIAQFCPCVQKLLRHPHDAAQGDIANRRLSDISERIKATAAYVMDLDGNTLAASNWDQPDSFVGKNYGLRPYFRDALNQGTGRMVAIGMTSGALGYYLAATIDDGPRPIGVIVVKVSVENLQEWLEQESESKQIQGLFADGNGVIFASSLPGTRYRTIVPLSAQTRQMLELARAYPGQPLSPLPITPLDDLGQGARVIRFGFPDDTTNAPEACYIDHHLVLTPGGWQIHALVPLARFDSLLWGHGVLGLVIGLMVGVIGVLFVQRVRKSPSPSA